jgi:predicted nuclease of predicted toxin-antitoxin system
MRIYLDDNMASPLLARLLANAGHDVQLPIAVGMVGKDDAVHLTHAIGDDRVCLSEDYDDFEKLHNLILRAQGHHPGILAVRRDNDPKRNPKPPGNVRAIAKLTMAGMRILKGNTQVYVHTPH